MPFEAALVAKTGVFAVGDCAGVGFIVFIFVLTELVSLDPGVLKVRLGLPESRFCGEDTILRAPWESALELRLGGCLIGWLASNVGSGRHGVRLKSSTGVERIWVARKYQATTKKSDAGSISYRTQELQITYPTSRFWRVSSSSDSPVVSRDKLNGSIESSVDLINITVS